MFKKLSKIILLVSFLLIPCCTSYSQTIGKTIFEALAYADSSVVDEIEVYPSGDTYSYAIKLKKLPYKILYITDKNDVIISVGFILSQKQWKENIGNLRVDYEKLSFYNYRKNIKIYNKTNNEILLCKVANDNRNYIIYIYKENCKILE